MSTLDDKVALVTGSTRGIGEASARLLAAKGASVTVCGRSASRGEEVSESITAAGGRAMYAQTDVGEQESVEAAVAQTVERFGRLDILVNNAAPTEVMGRQTNRLCDVPWDEFEEVMRVGFYGAVWACRAALPHMQEVGGGSIINVSSLAAHQGLPGLAAYSCSKGALAALTRQLAVDYASDGIRVNTVRLGIIINELTGAMMDVPGLDDAVRSLHLTRLGENDDVARIVAYLASDDAAFITGTEIPIDGGASIKGSVPGDAVKTGLATPTQAQP